MSTTSEQYRTFTQPVPNEGDTGEWKPTRTPHCMVVGADRADRDHAIAKIIADLRHANWRVLHADRTAEIVQDIQIAHDVMTQRYARMQETSPAACDEDCPVVLVVDEYSELVAAQRSVPADYDHESLLWRISDILHLGRAARVHLLLGSGPSLFEHVLPSMADGIVYANVAAPAPIGASR